MTAATTDNGVPGDDTSSPNDAAGVQVERSADGAVATVRLARPDAMNSLDGPTKVALRDALQQVAADDSVRAVVLTGSGRAFCVGQDLKEHVRRLAEDPLEEIWATVPDHYTPTALALLTMPKPVVAAVNGVAAGAGASLACACDFRIVADTAGFNTAFAGIALSCDTGASWTLPRLVGWAKARELLMLPRTVGAAEALELGLATEVVPADEVLDRAQAFAAQLAAGPTLAYASIKQALAYASVHSAEESLALEGELMGLTGASQDHRDAVAAFVAKQRPVFTGR
ncbi:MAG: enoyl-CoA hydratase/isomerase family protein [Actinomycetales bacterium]